MKIDSRPYIAKAIKDTAERIHDETVVDVASMMPHMSKVMKKEQYPKKYYENIQYAESEDALMDIYYPDKGEGPYPVFVEVHGGAWFFGQKSSVEFMPFLEGLNRGYVCVSVGYTLAPKCTYPQPVIEIKQAIDHLKKNAEKYNIDPDRIALIGGSAGAHLSALATYSNGTGYLDDGKYDNMVKVLVLWFGCHNYHIGKKLDKWMYQNFFGEEDLESIREKLILSNPGAHITKDVPYTILQHGYEDMLVSYQQSVYIADVIKSVAGEDRCCLDLLDGCDHADAKMFASDNIKRVFDMVDAHI